MKNQINVDNQNTQQIGQNPASQASQLPEKPKINYWMISTIVLATLFVLATGVIIINFRKITNDKSYSQGTSVQNSIEPTIVTQQQTSTPTPVTIGNLVPSPKPGFKQYLDENLRYGFNYQDSLPVSKCADIPCASIDTISLRVEPLETFHLSQPDPKASLLANDLYCSAGGPMGSIECKNTKVEDFTNLLGFKGFKVYRTKTVTGSGGGTSAGVYQDIAYVFPLQKVVKGQGLLNFAGILFAVDTSTKSNLSSLEEIANSFFNF